MLSVQIKPEYNADPISYNPTEKTFLRKRYDFFERYQNPEESLYAYLDVIRLLAEFCEFHVAERENLICCRFVSGLQDKQLQSFILESFEHPTIEEVLDMCAGKNKKEAVPQVEDVKVEDIVLVEIFEENDSAVNIFHHGMAESVEDDIDDGGENSESNEDNDNDNDNDCNDDGKRQTQQSSKGQIKIFPNRKNQKNDELELCNQCPVCDQMFNNFFSFRGHLVEHALYKEFTKADFKSPQSDNRLSDTKCTICRRQFNCHELLVQHYTVHSHSKMEMPKIKCTFCGKLTAVRYLKKHMYQHIPQGNFPCTLCKKVLNSKPQHKAHMKIHREHSSHVCDICGRTFIREVYLQTHKTKVHPVLDTKIKELQCYICKRVYISLPSLRGHLKWHSKDKNSHLCALCGACFRAASILERHLMRADHNGDHNKKFECTICKTRFYDRTQYVNHSTVHTKARPHACKYPGCDKVYRTKKTLREHERNHTGERPYKCKFCPYESINSTYLKRHNLVHTGRHK